MMGLQDPEGCDHEKEREDKPWTQHPLKPAGYEEKRPIRSLSSNCKVGFIE